MSASIYVSDFDISTYITGNHKWIKYDRNAKGEPVFSLNAEGAAAGDAGRRVLKMCRASYKAFLKQQHRLNAASTTNNTPVPPNTENSDISDDSIDDKA